MGGHIVCLVRTAKRRRRFSLIEDTPTKHVGESEETEVAFTPQSRPPRI